jgi:hypothetical protein
MSAPVTDASDIPSLKLPIMQKVKAGNTKGGSITAVDLLFDWFGLVCFANKRKNCQFSNS